MAARVTPGFMQTALPVVNLEFSPMCGIIIFEMSCIIMLHKRDSVKDYLQLETLLPCTMIQSQAYKMMLQNDGSLMNVVSLDGTIVEQEPVKCRSDDLTEFESVLYAYLNITDDPSDVELEALASSFVESYNQVNALNGETCDFSFRVVESAVVLRTKNPAGNGHNQILRNYLNDVFKIILSGRCRGCDPPGKPIGDGVGRCRAFESGNPVVTEHSEWMLGNAGQYITFRNQA
jgi:hypothetical protein